MINTTQTRVEPIHVPGKGKGFKTRAGEALSSTLQNFDPIKGFDLHISGCAFYSGQPDRQVVLHHYCSALNDDFYQCAVFDSDTRDAKLIGVEYIISEELFKTLDPEEQKLWHSHGYDVTSGSFVAPRLPATIENSLMKELTHTYGKTWIFWQVDKGDQLPLGIPQLMYVATKDGEWKEDLLRKRDNKMGYDYNKIRRDREAANITLTQPIGNADYWKHGKFPVLSMKEMEGTFHR